MFDLFQMWATVEVLGILCLPLTITVFHNLPDRGWAFSKALGMVIFAFCIWFPLMSVHVLPFSRLFIAGVALILLAGSVLCLLRVRQDVLKIIRHNLPYIVVAEILFLGMVFLLGWLRSYEPNIQSYEMFMDEGFIAGIMRSPHLPPNDFWFAGYSINYYYYAHFTIAILAKLLGQTPSIAFNTGICIFYGLTAVNLFGVTCNIVAWARYQRRLKQADPTAEPERPDVVLPSLVAAMPYGLLTMVMGLIFGNLAATQQWWQEMGSASMFNWFNPSRVVPNTINEFPAFSFLLSCFHAHVLTLAFTIMGIGLAFNLLLEHDGRGLFVFGRGWRLPITLGATALVLGGLFTMNGWDFPTYVGLAIVCIGFQQWEAYGRRLHISLLLDVFSAAVCLVVLSLLLFLPFYLTFQSPSGGIGLLPAGLRSQLPDEILIYGLFAFVFLSFLLAGVLKRPLYERDLPFALAEQAQEAESSQAALAIEQARGEESGEHVADIQTEEAVSSNLSWTVRLLLVVLYLLLSLLALKFIPNSITFVVCTCLAALAVVVMFYNLKDRSHAFALLLGGTAFALVAGCEIFFLRDAFAGSIDERMNTVFKFYFQAWALLSIASGSALFFILESFRPVSSSSFALRWSQRGVLVVWSLFLLALMAASSIYPIVAPYQRYAQVDSQANSYGLMHDFSLDGLDYLRTTPGSESDYYAIRWLNANVKGDPVIVEAVGDDYSSYGRISAFTGLPTIMGWAGHEVQWRLNWLNNPVNAANFNRRETDVQLIYTSPNPSVVLSTMARYNAQYLYLGTLERTKYPNVNLNRFSSFMQVVYNANGTTIYKVK